MRVDRLHSLFRVEGFPGFEAHLGENSSSRGVIRSSTTVETWATAAATTGNSVSNFEAPLLAARLF